MNLANVKVGDRVLCDKQGRVFEAVVTEKEPQRVIVDPPKGITYRRLSAREIKRKL